MTKSNQNQNPKEETPTEDPPVVEQDKETAEIVEVRVLTLCQLGVANDVVEVPGAAVEGLKSLGYVDDHPESVAYAKSLKSPRA